MLGLQRWSWWLSVVQGGCLQFVSSHAQRRDKKKEMRLRGLYHYLLSTLLSLLSSIRGGMGEGSKGETKKNALSSIDQLHHTVPLEKHGPKYS